MLGSTLLASLTSDHIAKTQGTPKPQNGKNKPTGLYVVVEIGGTGKPKRTQLQHRL
jgi:hypothetical protein